MRAPTLFTAGLAVTLGFLPVADAAEPAQPGADRVTVPGAAPAVEDGGPTVLRGSAIAPRPAPEPPSPARFTIVAGERLWLVDPASGDVVACRERGTSTVGERVVRCTVGDLPRTVTK